MSWEWEEEMLSTLVISFDDSSNAFRVRIIIIVEDGFDGFWSHVIVDQVGTLAPLSLVAKTSNVRLPMI